MKARTTIAVVPREAHSWTVETIETLYRNTPAPVRLVVVDGGAPEAIRHRLVRLARARDFTLIRRDAELTGNEARNLAFGHVATEYVVFLDNDTMVSPGWLEGLERCADETHAALVAPVVTWGPSDDRRVHFAGGTEHIEDDERGRRLVERNTHINQPVSVIATLSRSPSEYLELHCLLARSDVVHAVGGFDEALLASRDHTDLSLRVRDAGGTGWVEPAIVVGYPWPKPLAWHDRPFFHARWSDAWNEQSLARFNDVWRITETSIDDVFRVGHLNRRLGWESRRLGGWHGHVQRARRRALRLLDLVATPLAVRQVVRRRARAAPATVAHAASWDEGATGARRGVAFG